MSPPPPPSQTTRGAVALEDVSFLSPSSSSLPPEVISAYKDFGFVCLNGFLSREETEALKERANALEREHRERKREEDEKKTIFTTGEKKQASSCSDEYFLNSAGNVSYFYEEKEEETLNKIGHALHDLDDTFKAFSRSEKMKRFLEQLGLLKPTPVQSMIIFKNARCGGEVVPHQDDTFLRTGPEKSTVGVWVALEKCTVENGCLRALPRSHLNGTRKRMFVNHEEVERKVQFSDEGEGEEIEYKIEEFVPLTVDAGTLVFLHGENVHWSLANTSEKNRLAYSVHYVEGGKESCVWLKDNWLQRPETFPFQCL
jgi:phytanoyl-CoA hydroxylase